MDTKLTMAVRYFPFRDGSVQYRSVNSTEGPISSTHSFSSRLIMGLLLFLVTHEIYKIHEEFLQRQEQDV